MRCATDLHLHSCLSPCGDELMTPNNIVNMARIKGLDVIAVTDHNSASNLPAIQAVADRAGVVLLPGIEAETAEEVHCLCYFAAVDAALSFGETLRAHLPGIRNNPDFFGEQIVMDENDEPAGREDLLLIQATDIPLDALNSLCMERGGLCVPAHINRGANGLLMTLGMLPADVVFAALEVSRSAPAPSAPLGEYKVIYSSDAHRLEDIFERDHFLDIPERSAEGMMEYLRQCRDRVVGAKG